MGKFIKSKKVIGLTLLVILVLAAAIFVKLIFWKSNYTSPEYKFSAQLFSKIIKAQSEGSTAEITKDELNQIIFLYFKEYRKGDLVVKSIESDISDNNLIFYVPVSYRGINLFAWSEGSISLDGSKIKYTPEYFKIGKITLPKSYILQKLGKSLNTKTNTVAVQQNSITIDIGNFPIGITSIDVKDKKLLVTLEKREFNIEDILKGKISSMKNFIEDFSGANKSSSETKTDDSKVDKSSTGEDTKSKTTSQDSTTSSTPVSNEKQNALDSVASGLNAASASVSTGAQKAVISQMISVVNNMKDSSYNPYSEEGSVRAAYGKLSQTEKTELKAAVFSNVDTSEVSILADMIGN